MTAYPTQSHYPDYVLTSPCPILALPSAGLRSDKYQFYKSSVWLGWNSNLGPCTQKARALPNQPPRAVYILINKQKLRMAETQYHHRTMQLQQLLLTALVSLSHCHIRLVQSLFTDTHPHIRAHTHTLTPPLHTIQITPPYHKHHRTSQSHHHPSTSPKSAFFGVLTRHYAK